MATTPVRGFFGRFSLPRLVPRFGDPVHDGNARPRKNALDEVSHRHAPEVGGGCEVSGASGKYWKNPEELFRKVTSRYV